MRDPVTGLRITKAQWQQLADRANVKTPEAKISRDTVQRDELDKKTPQNALQSDLGVSGDKGISVKSVPVPGRKRKKVIVEDDGDQV